jgi:hypothetical protein
MRKKNFKFRTMNDLLLAISSYKSRDEARRVSTARHASDITSSGGLKYINMKIIMILILLAVPLSIAIAQGNKLLTPEEMRADADFYFASLYKDHPNPYYYCSLEEFENKKNKIYAQLDKSRTRDDFLQILGEINSCVDVHSWINFIDDDRRRVNAEDTLFPPVRIIDGKLFLADNLMDEITEINGVPVEQIVSDCQKFFNWKLPHKANLNILECWILYEFHFKYNIKAPYEVRFNRENKTKIIDGISHKKSVDENYNRLRVRGEFEKKTMTNDIAHYYRIYPSRSIAIFYINTFARLFKDNFNDVLTQFMNEVNNQKIKYIFYDLSKNTGGNAIGQNRAFDIVRHDTIYHKVTEIKRQNNFNRKYEINDILLKPNHAGIIPKDRQLFVIIGNMTASMADYFCRVTTKNKLGILVGQDAGEPTKAFSHAYPHTLPNSKFDLQIASTFVDFSDYFDGETLKPDIYYDVHHNREFTEKELMDIINIRKTKAYVQTK